MHARSKRVRLHLARRVAPPDRRGRVACSAKSVLNPLYIVSKSGAFLHQTARAERDAEDGGKATREAKKRTEC